MAAMKVLDLFCGAGGAAMGLHRAWPDAEIIGVDIKPQPHYPFTFVQADALAYPTADFDFIWASPPCQRFSSASKINPATKPLDRHADLVAPIREKLRLSGLPYVIENVEGAPLLDPITLCGSMFGLMLLDDFYGGYLRRHRLFESNVSLEPPSACKHEGRALGVFGHGSSGKRKTNTNAPGGISLPARLAYQIMGIDWMNRDEVAQAIPPAYSEYIANQLTSPPQPSSPAGAASLEK